MNDYILNKIKSEYNNYDEFKIYLEKKFISSFRINRLKTDINEVNNYLYKNNINFFNANFFSDCFIIDSMDEELIKKSFLYDEGKIYFQSVSSMLPVLFHDFKIGENVLDMCASPGGKCLLIQSLMNNKVNLTATELHFDRYNKLIHNINKNNANIFVKNINSLDLDDMLKFDFILLDAPCSGTGTINIFDNIDEEYLNRIISKQKKLIMKAYKLLKNNGVMIYSTCSILREENEFEEEYAINTAHFKKCNIKIEGELSNLLKYDNIVFDENKIKILPNKFFEGFFISKFIK